MLLLDADSKRFDTKKPSIPDSARHVLHRANHQTLSPNQCQGTLLDKQALLDIVNGAALLSAGGGGPKSMAFEMIETMDNNQQVEMVPLAAVGDDDWVVVSAFLGSPEAANALANVQYNSPTRAVKKLQKYSGCTAKFIVPVEIGAVSSITPINTAWDLNIPVVDADGAGRAVPTLSCLTFGTQDQLLDKGLVLTNETEALDKQQSAFVEVKQTNAAEALAGGIVTTDAFGNLAGLAMWMMQGHQLKALAIEGGLSHSRMLGQALRQTPVATPNINYAALTVETLQASGFAATILAQSVSVIAFESATEKALDHGKLTLKTKDNDIITIYIVNENMLAYRSSQSQPFIMSPDLLCCILSDGTTLDNLELQKRAEQQNPDQPLVLSLIGIEAAPRLKDNEKIITAFLGIFGQLGYAGSYEPFKA